jgi:4-amino-4-deoxy-L-arabinose transferase-like glycosyltransferase
VSCFNGDIKKESNYFFSNIIFPYLSIIIFIAILYYPSFECHFKTEDFTLIEDARNNFSSYNSFVTEFFSPQFYRPITRRIFFSISYALFELNPTGSRIINIILFILNNFLVYEIASILTKRKDVALIASIFYFTRGAHLIAIYWITVGFQDNGVAFLFSVPYCCTCSILTLKTNYFIYQV